nr:MAG TPA: hypothetical protein [Caudoviricetes sp.]
MHCILYTNTQTVNRRNIQTIQESRVIECSVMGIFRLLELIFCPCNSY